MKPATILTTTATTQARLAAILILTAAAPHMLRAQSTGVWNNVAGGSWATNGNWTPAVAAGGADNVADFATLDLATNVTVTLDGARTIGGLVFGDTVASHSWTLATGSGGPLTLGVAAGSPTIGVTNQAATISAVLAGTQGFTKTGAGTLSLGSANSLTGGFIVDGGMVSINCPGYANAIAGGTITVNSGQLLLVPVNVVNNVGLVINAGGTVVAGGSHMHFANSVSLNGGTITGSGSGKYNGDDFQLDTTLNVGGTQASTITLPNGMSMNGTQTVYVADSTGNSNADLVVTGQIHNVSGGVTGMIKAGPGMMTLASQNTYTGGTTVSNGVLNLAYASGGAAAINGTVTVLGGAELRLSGGDGSGLGYGNAAGGQKIGTLNIVGGLVNLTLSSHFYYATVNMTGGEFRINPLTPCQFGNVTVNTLASTNPSVISGGVVIRGDSWNNLTPLLTFNVAYGGTVTDLLVNAAVSESSNTGPGRLVKSGSGLMVLSGTNTYTGGTTISNGTLRISGSLAAAGAVTIKAGATLSGAGRIGGAVVAEDGATLAPGSESPGALRIGDSLSLAAGSTNTLRIAKAGTALSNDAVTMTTGTGSVAYGGTLNVSASGDPLAAGDKFILFRKGTSGTYSGSFAATNLPDPGPGLQWSTARLAVDGSIKVLSSTATDRPEFDPPPGSYIGGQSVTISTLTDAATIYYTTDGSDPMTSGTRSSGTSPITGLAVPADSTLLIQAFAAKDGLSTSSVSSASYATVSVPTWTNSTGGSWATEANWMAGIIGQGNDATARFDTLTLANNASVTLDGAFVVGNLLFGDRGNLFSWGIGAGTGGSLTLAGTAPTITVTNRSLTITAAISGTNGLVKAGAGILVLTAANPFTGGAHVTGGTLFANGPNSTLGALGGGDVTVHSNATITVGSDNSFVGNGTSGSRSVTILEGGLVLNSGASTCHLNLLALGGGTLQATTANGTYGNWNLDFGVATLNLGNTSRMTGGNAALTQVGGVVFNVAASDTLYVGTALDHVAHTGFVDRGLVKTGSGTLVLAGANSYVGATLLSNGTTWVSGSLANTAIAVGAGATLGGSGVIGGTVTVSSGGHLAPGSATETLTLTNGLTLADGAILDLAPGNSSNLLAITGGTFQGSGPAGTTLRVLPGNGYRGQPIIVADWSGATLLGVDMDDFAVVLTPGYDGKPVLFVQENKLILQGLRGSVLKVR